jgi:hypothetical protein
MQQLTSLKVIGPLNSFMEDTKVECNLQELKSLEPSCGENPVWAYILSPNKRYLTKVVCLLKATTPNLRNLQLERVGDCEETFWQIGKFHQLDKLIIKTSMTLTATFILHGTHSLHPFVKRTGGFGPLHSRKSHFTMIVNHLIWFHPGRLQDDAFLKSNRWNMPHLKSVIRYTNHVALHGRWE